MTKDSCPPDSIASELPFLRRYGRALTGGQDSGDRYALAAFETILAEPDRIATDPTTRLGLFRVFHDLWSSADERVSGLPRQDDLLEARVQWRLGTAGANTREALLLNTIEGFSTIEIAHILGSDTETAAGLVTRAIADMGDAIPGNVLIIEDEAVVAMDLRDITTEMGHTVTGIARTREEAVAQGKADAPDLILADIQLADRSSGIDAVNALLYEVGDRPVIFITAFPEQLLSGEGPEPAFLIGKPFSENQVRAAISQALFFATTQMVDVVD